MHPTFQRDSLVKQYLPYATVVAKMIARSLPSHVDYEDVLGNARFGLLEAAERFDEKFSSDFKTYAYHRIRGAIYDGLRKTEWIPRYMYANDPSPLHILLVENLEDYDRPDTTVESPLEGRSDFQAIKEKIRTAIEALPGNEKKLITMYYFEECSLEEIGLRMNLSRSWASRLRLRALKHLYQKLLRSPSHLDT